MKLFPTRLFIFLLAVIILLPALLARGCDWTVAPRPSEARGGTLVISVWMPAEGKAVEMDLESYVQGVVAGEMPSSFDMEALKAQAVAARTYAVRHMRRFGGRGFEGDGSGQADVSADPATNQNFLTLAQLEAKEGSAEARAFWGRIRQAVEATQGEIILYRGAPIEAVYHSTDAGSTEDASAVWSGSYPYLKSVRSDDTASPRYTSTFRIGVSELASRLGIRSLAAPAASPNSLIQVVERTPGGRAAKVKVGDKTLSGTEFRSLLGTEFRSTLFSWKVVGKDVEFAVRGSGHGVGMSQWGANALARQGKTYQEILRYYYTGVDIGRIFQE